MIDESGISQVLFESREATMDINKEEQEAKVSIILILNTTKLKIAKERTLLLDKTVSSLQGMPSSCFLQAVSGTNKQTSLDA